MLLLFGVIAIAGVFTLLFMLRAGVQFTWSSITSLIPMIIGILPILLILIFASRFLQSAFGKDGEAAKYQERRKEDSETIRRQREGLEKMARRIESLETILMDEAPPPRPPK